MTISLFFDVDVTRHSVVTGLRKRGVDVLTSLEAGTIEETDETQLAFATAEGRAIYSFNVGDFCDLNFRWLSRAVSVHGSVGDWRIFRRSRIAASTRPGPKTWADPRLFTDP